MNIESYPVDWTTNIALDGDLNWNDERLYK